MPKRKKRREEKPSNNIAKKLAKDMETETALLTLYKGVAFRLPALQLGVDESPREKRQAHECPREMRVVAASEDALFERHKKQWLQKKTALLKRNRNKTENQLQSDGHQTSIVESPQSELNDSLDAMGFLARELTEVKDALENKKHSIKRDTLKGLRKVVAGVLHTLRQDQLKTVLDSMNVSSSMKYENITQAASLSPRVVHKADKREPANREFHVCKGCKEGGLLPWMYLYPDHEVYRTGGGFDCVEFHLPVVHSEKSLTKPKDPFDKHRGKLVNTSMHKLPERIPAHVTKPVPFNFKKDRQGSDALFKAPQSEINPSVIRKVEFGKRRPRTVPELEETKKSNGRSLATNELDKELPVHSSLETITSSRDKESDSFNTTMSSSNTLILGWQRSGFSMETDSGVVTAGSSASENRSLENGNANEKIANRALQLSELNNLQKRITGYDTLGPLRVSKQKAESELPKAPKKLVIRKSMALSTNVKDMKSIHNSGLLSRNNQSSTNTKNAFGVRTKPLKSIAYRKKSTAIETAVSKEVNANSSTTVSEMSVNFSSTLSLETNSQQETIEDEYSDFTLTGSQVTGTKRYLKDYKRMPRAKERKVSKATKRMAEVTPIKEEAEKKEKSSKKEKRRKKSEENEENKNGTTEVFIDMISSMVSDSITPEAIENESLSRLSSCRGSRRNFREQTVDSDVSGTDITKLNNLSSADETIDVAEMDLDVDKDSFKREDTEDFDDDDSEDFDEVGDLPEVEGEKPSGKKSRRKLRKRKTLEFRSEPLSKFMLRRRKQGDSEFASEMEEDDDLSMLDYAARYCIISLEKLSKYENVFSSFASCGGEADEHDNDDLGSDIEVNSDEQKKILKEYEKLIYSMDVYQQKISEAERKRAELRGEKETTLSNINGLQIDEQKKKLLEKSVQAFSKKITSVDDRIRNFVDNVKKMIEKKRFLEDKLRESEMDSEKVDKIIKNSDFLGRKFTKLKCLKIKVEDLPDALKSFNPSFDDEDFRFVNHVLKLPQNDSLDFKAFAVVSALTERVKSLDKSIKAILKDVDLGTLERKLDKCKELYRLLSEEHHDGHRTVPLENLLVELQAGGLDRDHQRSVVDKLNHHGHGFVDFLDFVLYIPLFLMIHDQIVQKPFE